jgi:hypothetical protein
MTWTTRNFLELVFDFVDLSPEQEDWNLSSLKDNPPRLIRLQRILSLLDAYGIKIHGVSKSFVNSEGVLVLNQESVEDEDDNHLQAFIEGNFIGIRTSEELQSAFSLLSQLKQLDSSEPLNRADAYFFFKTCLEYRLLVNHSNSYTSRFLAASPNGLRTAIRTINAVNKEITNQLKEIDEILFRLINPMELTFDQKLLEDKYGFPPDDLDEIDWQFY